MRPGLARYDLASLLYDPYVSLTATERTELLEFYRDDGRDQRPGFAENFQLCAMQRLMQALGAYGYLGLVKKNAASSAHPARARFVRRSPGRDRRAVEPLARAGCRGFARQRGARE